MMEYGGIIILGTSQPIPEIEADTENFLQKLASITGNLLDKVKPISFEKYIIEVNRLQEKHSSPSDVTPSMVKTKALNPEISEIRWRPFNLPWFTG